LLALTFAIAATGTPTIPIETLAGLASVGFPTGSPHFEVNQTAI
jgi:hypothetical protein